MTESVRRVVTGHDSEGKAIIQIDGDAPNVKVRGEVGIASTLCWVTEETPARLDDGDTADRQIGVPPPLDGSIFRIVEFPPEGEQKGGVSAEAMRAEMGVTVGGGPPRHPGMHRTRSVDYAIIMTGEIDMLMDDSEVHLKAGDVIVQQGTNHAWANRSNAPCQIAFILIGAHVPWED